MTKFTMGFNRRICLQIAVPSTLRAHSHYLRPSTDLNDSAWGAHEMHCPSIRLRGLRQKVEKRSTFQEAADPSANQIAVMQLHSAHLLDTFCNNKQEEDGNWPFIFFKEMWNHRIVLSHLFVSSSAFLSTHQLCSGKRFNLSQTPKLFGWQYDHF